MTSYLVICSFYLEVQDISQQTAKNVGFRSSTQPTYLPCGRIGGNIAPLTHILHHHLIAKKAA
ncbi:MAG: hypothetical protein DSM106950_44355 [Stigonema ocellatum SAG 48.90 = DSM 106950]|nr:hypothetical protein [Stigonema ocellatum SAG 48.90 = DSM 106950]